MFHMSTIYYNFKLCNLNYGIEDDNLSITVVLAFFLFSYANAYCHCTRGPHYDSEYQAEEGNVHPSFKGPIRWGRGIPRSPRLMLRDIPPSGKYFLHPQCLKSSIYRKTISNILSDLYEPGTVL